MFRSPQIFFLCFSCWITTAAQADLRDLFLTKKKNSVDQPSEENQTPTKRVYQPFRFKKVEATGLKHFPAISPDQPLAKVLGVELVSGGIGAGDFDRDGLIDIILAHGPNGITLHQGTGPFAFRDATDVSGIPLGLGWPAGLTVTDLDRDGDSDFIVADLQSNARAFRNISDPDSLYPQFEEATKDWNLNETPISIGVAIADTNRDSQLDLFFVTPETPAGKPKGPGRLYQRLNNQWADFTQKAGITGIGGAVSAHWFDWNRDGYPELFCGSDGSGPSRLFVNTISAPFKDSFQQLVTTMPQRPIRSRPADIDGNGWSDLFLIDHTANQTRCQALLNHGVPRLLEASNLLNLAEIDSSGELLIEDFDGDGWLDIITPAGRALQNLGGMGFTDVTDEWNLPEMPAITSAISLDLDGDGDLDLLLRHSGEPPTVLEATGGYSGRVTLTLKGWKSHPSGVGTRVEVATQTASSSRDMFPQRSTTSSGPIQLNLGLGDAAEIDSIRVMWPSGAIQEILAVAAGTQLQFCWRRLGRTRGSRATLGHQSRSSGQSSTGRSARRIRWLRRLGRARTIWLRLTVPMQSVGVGCCKEARRRIPWTARRQRWCHSRSRRRRDSHRNVPVRDGLYLRPGSL
ncbi:MAG: CRTAC1 family protein [Verrucomicrobiota bacterium]